MYDPFGDDDSFDFDGIYGSKTPAQVQISTTKPQATSKPKRVTSTYDDYSEAIVPYVDSKSNSTDIVTIDRHSSHWQHDKDAKVCAICKSSFTLIKRRHHCRKCGLVICGQCSRFLHLRKGQKPIRVCISCPQDVDSIAPVTRAMPQPRPVHLSEGGIVGGASLGETKAPGTGKKKKTKRKTVKDSSSNKTSFSRQPARQRDALFDDEQWDTFQDAPPENIAAQEPARRSNEYDFRSTAQVRAVPERFSAPAMREYDPFAMPSPENRNTLFANSNSPDLFDDYQAYPAKKNSSQVPYSRENGLKAGYDLEALDFYSNVSQQQKTAKPVVAPTQAEPKRSDEDLAARDIPKPLPDERLDSSSSSSESNIGSSIKKFFGINTSKKKRKSKRKKLDKHKAAKTVQDAEDKVQTQASAEETTPQTLSQSITVIEEPKLVQDETGRTMVQAMISAPIQRERRDTFDDIFDDPTKSTNGLSAASRYDRIRAADNTVVPITADTSSQSNRRDNVGSGYTSYYDRLLNKTSASAERISENAPASTQNNWSSVGRGYTSYYDHQEEIALQPGQRGTSSLGYSTYYDKAASSTIYPVSTTTSVQSAGNVDVRPRADTFDDLFNDAPAPTTRVPPSNEQPQSLPKTVEVSNYIDELRYQEPHVESKESKAEPLVPFPGVVERETDSNANSAIVGKLSSLENEIASLKALLKESVTRNMMGMNTNTDADQRNVQAARPEKSQAILQSYANDTLEQTHVASASNYTKKQHRRKGSFDDLFQESTKSNFNDLYGGDDAPSTEEDVSDDFVSAAQLKKLKAKHRKAKLSPEEPPEAVNDEDVADEKVKFREAMPRDSNLSRARRKPRKKDPIDSLFNASDEDDTPSFVDLYGDDSQVNTKADDDKSDDTREEKEDKDYFSAAKLEQIKASQHLKQQTSRSIEADTTMDVAMQEHSTGNDKPRVSEVKKKGDPIDSLFHSDDEDGAPSFANLYEDDKATFSDTLANENREDVDSFISASKLKEIKAKQRRKKDSAKGSEQSVVDNVAELQADVSKPTVVEMPADVSTDRQADKPDTVLETTNIAEAFEEKALEKSEIRRGKELIIDKMEPAPIEEGLKESGDVSRSDNSSSGIAEEIDVKTENTSSGLDEEELPSLRKLSSVGRSSRKALQTSSNPQYLQRVVPEATMVEKQQVDEQQVEIADHPLEKERIITSNENATLSVEGQSTDVAMPMDLELDQDTTSEITILAQKVAPREPAVQDKMKEVFAENNIGVLPTDTLVEAEIAQEEVSVKNDILSVPPTSAVDESEINEKTIDAKTVIAEVSKPLLKDSFAVFGEAPSAEMEFMDAETTNLVQNQMQPAEENTDDEEIGIPMSSISDRNTMPKVIAESEELFSGMEKVSNEEYNQTWLQLQEEEKKRKQKSIARQRQLQKEKQKQKLLNSQKNKAKKSSKEKDSKGSKKEKSRDGKKSSRSRDKRKKSSDERGKTKEKAAPEIQE